MHVRSALILLLTFFVAAAAVAQDDGSLRGYITDDTGAALPGVTVTAASNVLIGGSRTAVTDGSGYYRLINLPPGDYTLTAELASFAIYRREGIVVRPGVTLSVDIGMQLSSVQETITVTAETPMLDIARPSNVLNIEGEFMQDMPIQSRRNWSDFLELTPGVNARPFDDGSGRMVYFGHATEHFAHVSQLDGMTFGGYQDFQLTYMGLPADAIEDNSVKTGGVDASNPTGTGLVINLVTKSGGNNFSGSAAYTLQPFSWNGDNTGEVGGLPTTSKVNQLDFTFGGPIRQDKVWFFGALRYADLEAGISRTENNVRDLEAFFPGFDFFNNITESTQPYVKVTGQIDPNHQLSGTYQNDRLFATGDREYHYTPTSTLYETGGSLYSGKLNSVWGSNLTSQIIVGYNDKGGSTASTFEPYPLSGPEVAIHREAFASAGRVTGSGRLISGGNREGGQESYSPSSLVMIRADFTYYKDALAGSHEFQAGFFGAPRNTYDTVTNYVNDGFILEEVRQIDPNNPAAGTVPFHRRYQTPTSLLIREARERDYALYVSDSWKPHPRLTLNIGVRADFVKRHDNIFDIDRMTDTAIAPRAGFSYMLTKDARNVIRGSFNRIYEQVMGRDAVTLFGGTAGTVRADLLDTYDADGDGVFESQIFQPAVAASLGSSEFDPNLHQPWVDEWILGFRKQFAGEFAVDVAVIDREYKHTYARVDINGIYPEGPGQPFIGFGRVDPNRGIFFQQTNNTWSTLNYTALEITATKNLRNNFQVLASINRQWQSIQGEYNPTDPARFIQPETFPNDAGLYMPRGNNEENSLPPPGTTTLTYGPTWIDYSIRLGGTYFAPKGIVLGLSYSHVAGPWSGAVVDRLAATDPEVTRFGPPTVPLANGRTAPNPLNTVIRNAFETRGDGQTRAPAIGTLGLKIGKKFPLGGTREIEVSGNLLNILNGDNYWQYNYNGASELFNPNYLQMRNLQYARSFQMFMAFRF
jgi:hypothetical protein